MDIQHLINELSTERAASTRTDEPDTTPRASPATTSPQPVDPNPGPHLLLPFLEGIGCLSRGGDGGSPPFACVTAGFGMYFSRLAMATTQRMLEWRCLPDIIPSRTTSLK